MAVKDVKKYYLKMLSQYTEEKENLKDYEQAFKDSFITEDQLDEAKAYFAALETNFERIKYIMFLLDSPKRAAKKPKYNKQYKKQLEEFEKRKATESQVVEENKKLMGEINDSLDKLISK